MVEENTLYREKLEYVEGKLETEVRDIKKQIQGIKHNLESIVDIVKVPA